MLEETFTGSISNGDSTCFSGVFNRPCKIVTLPIHHTGTLDATLNWSGSTNLDLTLAPGNPIDDIIALSAGVSGAPEHVSAKVSGGSNYELRIIYSSGTTVSNYSLRVSRPN